MYLSRLTLNPRDRNARRDLSSPYELHSTLARMFADAPQQTERVLFRLERGENRVLIQSRTRPDPRWPTASKSCAASGLPKGP